MNLVTAIKQTENKIISEESAHQRKIKELRDGLEFLRKNNTTCEKCEGKGTVPRRICTDADVEQVTCRVCGGSGKEVK